ncbi:MAG: HAMP domain-containing sensor histidine kinase [Gammaproteobacteria bacterium]|nr:HAMP domain-containing sensor histidine kinase [Gammaproteobacteria bacterium]
MLKASLKTRIIIALVVIVTVTSALFAGGVLFIKARLEAVIFGDMVSAQFEDLLGLLERNDYHPEHLFPGWKFYFEDEVVVLPSAITRLPVGSHHSIRAGEGIYQVEVGEWRGRPAYLTYDVTEWENQEHAVLLMLLYGLLIVLVAAVVMGLSASRAILAPVQQLSRRLTEIQPGQDEVRIGEDYQGTEIGQIAAAFDKYLERLDRFVERERSFTASASHELRTPLSVMMGAVDVLAANPQSAASLRALERIRRACRDMLAFIEATLFLSREEGNQIDQGAPADLVKIVESLLEDSSAALQYKHLAVEKNYTAAPTLAHPQSLVQIAVGNLLRNAIEHTSVGRIAIHIDDRHITITDTGEGIGAEQLATIFERTFSSKSGGTGLGLNLVKRICDRLGWRISIESDVGVGTTVGITF